MLVESPPPASSRAPSSWLPLVCDGAAIGLIQVTGASPAELASGRHALLARAGGDGRQRRSRTRSATGTRAESLERFQGLIEHMPAITYVDRAVTGEPIYVSPQLETMSGVAVEQWLDGTDGWSQRVHPDDRDRALGAYREALASGIAYCDEYRLLDTEGARALVPRPDRRRPRRARHARSRSRA